MRLIKYITAILVSLINVLLSSRTIDSDFNPFTILGLVFYAFNSNEYAYICAIYFWMSFFTFASFAFLLTKEIIGKKVIIYVSLQVVPLVFLFFHHKWINNVFSESIINRINSFCGYSGGAQSLLINLFFQIIHIIVISYILIKIQRKHSDRYQM